jgi:TRAP-type C4-dicarboxylate transport system permease small subunit
MHLRKQLAQGYAHVAVPAGMLAVGVLAVQRASRAYSAAETAVSSAHKAQVGLPALGFS